MMKKMRCGWIGKKATGLDWAAKLMFCAVAINSYSGFV